MRFVIHRLPGNWTLDTSPPSFLSESARGSVCWQAAECGKSTTSLRESNNRHQPYYSQSREYYGECCGDSGTLDRCLGHVNPYIAWAAISPVLEYQHIGLGLTPVLGWKHGRTPRNGKRHSPKYLLTEGPDKIIIQPDNYFALPNVFIEATGPIISLRERAALATLQGQK